MQSKEMVAGNTPNASGSPGRKGRSEAGYVDPESLIADLSRPQMGRMLVYALLIHLFFIAVSSIGFISLCVKHHTLSPRQVISKLDKEAAEKKAKDDAGKAAEEAVKLAKANAEEATKNAKAKAAASNAATQAAGNDAQPPQGQAAEKKKSKTELELEKTSSERPTKPSVGLDLTPDLE